MKIIFFNGPPRSGKDTASHLIGSSDLHPRINLSRYLLHYIKMAAPIKEGVHSLFGLTPDENLLEHCKDEPNEQLLGKTPREMYISMSEDYLKPMFGRDVFSRIFTNKLSTLATALAGEDIEPLVICADCGFKEEIEPVVNLYGTKNILLLQLQRRGCDFSNDSRSYVSHPDVRTATLYNNGTQQDLAFQVDLQVKEWLEQFDAKEATKT